MKRFLLLILGYFLIQLAMAGPDTSHYGIPINRQLYHDNIDREQKKYLLQKPGSGALIPVSTSDEINIQVTDAIIRQVNELQDSIELNENLDHRRKVKYLRGLENLVKEFNSGWKSKSLNPCHAPELVANYKELMDADIHGRSIESIVEEDSFEAGNVNVNSSNSVLFDNPGYAVSKTILFRKFCTLHPDQILPKLEYYPYLPFADSLITVAGHLYPDQLYDYAAATRTRVGQMIRRNNDPMVKAITQMASSKSGRLFYPFLDEVMHDRITIEDISHVMNDSIQYYKLLVKTQIGFTERLLRKDTPMGAREMVKMLERKAEDPFINTINALHDAQDPVRFRILEQLTPQELYYLIVLREEIIYTSSYKGTYVRMMQRMKTPAGDSLMMSVKFDRFKKFIKMAAGYNKLDEFLRTMPDTSAQRLMEAFVRGLEKTGNLEEAVDVADSYGSINNPAVKMLIDHEIEQNLEISRKNGDKRSITIYQILQTIFQSSQDSTIDVSQKLGIPPVYRVDYSNLADDSGRVVQLVFFYGDKDGLESYSNFMSLFNSADWKINRNKEWTEIKSTRGRPVWIYANLPLDNSKGNDPDEKAQEHLAAWLEARHLKPTIVIHRGHSYHVKYTIKQLPPSAKIVILGSCGGYHNLDDVLRTCPDAHIISSKEVGTKSVNEPILRAINEDLRGGRNVEWIPMWKSLSTQFTSAEGKERFDNYIPPHKNLGALFLKAYTKAMGGELD